MAFCAPSQILLGTDLPILPLHAEIAAWRRLDLDPAQRRRIESGNALALLQRQVPWTLEEENRGEP